MSKEAVMNIEDLYPDDDAREDIETLANKIGQTMDGYPVDLALWALTFTVGRLISYAAKDLAEQRTLVAGFTHNVVSGLPSGVEIVGETLCAGGGPPPRGDEVREIQAVTPTVMAVMYGMIENFGPSSVISSFISAIANLFASGDENFVKFGQDVLREVADNLPTTHTDFVAATEMSSRINTTEVGNA